MALAMRKEEYEYTYGDYLHWPDGEHWEIIDGVAYNMSPAPTVDHQEISGELHRQLATFLLGKSCRVFAAPFDVVLPNAGEREEDTKTVVQPDIVVICDRKKITRRGCTGAPDMVVEILSPATATRDLKVKKALYDRVGVREFWIVHPDEKWVQIYIRNTEGKLTLVDTFGGEDTPEVSILPGLRIDMQLVFANVGEEEVVLAKKVTVHGPPA